VDLGTVWGGEILLVLIYINLNIQEVPEEFWAKGSPSTEEGNNMDCATINLVGAELFWVDKPCG
jgi:hypothetical protein